MPYRLIKQEGAARRGEFTTVHGTVQTPAFQNVATAAAIKGGLSATNSWLRWAVCTSLPSGTAPS